MLYVHAELKDTDFVEPLVCALRQVLTAGVDVKDISLPLDSALLATPTQKCQISSRALRCGTEGR